MLARRTGVKAAFPREYANWQKYPLLLLPSPLTSTQSMMVHLHSDFWGKARSYVCLLYTSGQRFVNTNSVADWVLGGWQTQGIFGFTTGQAFTPRMSYDPTNTGSVEPRPDIIGNPRDFSSLAGYSATNPPTSSSFGTQYPGCSMANPHQNINCWYNPLAYACLLYTSRCV